MRQHSPFLFLRSQVRFFIANRFGYTIIIQRIYSAIRSLPYSDLGACYFVMKTAGKA